MHAEALAVLEAHVAEVRRLVAQLKTLGHDTTEDEAMLAELELLLDTVRAESEDPAA